MSYWGTIVSAAIGAFLANFAAEYVRSLTRFAQRIEAERDEDLEYILDTVREVLDNSIKYWTHDAKDLGVDDLILSEFIVAGQYILTHRIELLFEESPKARDDSFDEVRDFMTAATEGDFNNPAADFMNPERTANSNKLRGMISAAETLRHGVRTRRRRLPRKHFAFLRRRHRKSRPTAPSAPPNGG